MSLKQKSNDYTLINHLWFWRKKITLEKQFDNLNANNLLDKSYISHLSKIETDSNI
jgi:iron complex outermembrane receptor protein